MKTLEIIENVTKRRSSERATIFHKVKFRVAHTFLDAQTHASKLHFSHKTIVNAELSTTPALFFRSLWL